MSKKVWKMRHAGSPQMMENLTDVDILEGVQEGIWEPTDEVMGPHDDDWTVLESHSHFEEIMAEYEPPIRQEPPDESKLDMNPMIDVALVLLVFFILTTTYESLRKVIDIPAQPKTDDSMKKSNVTILQQEEVQKLIQVTATMEGDKPVIRLNKEIVAEDQLETKLIEALKRSEKPEILLDTVGVSWGTEVKILDAAKGAGVQQVLKRARPEKQ